MSADTAVRHPTVLWAQREDIIYLTIDLHDAENAVIDLQEQSIDFKNTTSDGSQYAFHLSFYKAIKPDASKKSATGRKTLLVLEKAEGGWWPRLTEGTGKLNFLKTDFDHWKDEDDSEDEQPAFPGMDFSQMGMGGMPGMPGMGGMGGMPGLEGLMGGAGGMPSFGDNDDDGSDNSDDQGEEQK
ncbi:p23 chaperone protein wos2 [Coemansia sp. Benny D115]|nr:p23 chaperone protein wos2 [Coemansia sp. Benny D115]